MGFITGPWSGIPNLAITILICTLVIGVGGILSDRMGKQYAPFVMVGLITGLQIMMSLTSGKFVGLTMNGVDFFIIGGSLMYPVLALGEDYLNEFYGEAVAKSAVYAQFIARVLTTLVLVWMIFLPAPSFNAGNYDVFAEVMGSVPRVAVASMIATYFGGIINVVVFAKIKEKTGGRMLWLRTFSSTVLGLLVNSVLFTILAFAGAVPVSALLEMIFISAIIRIVTGFIEVAFLYIMTFLKHKGLIMTHTEPLVITPYMEEEV